LRGKHGHKLSADHTAGKSAAGNRARFQRSLAGETER
jgi:hypothetical protein